MRNFPRPAYIPTMGGCSPKDEIILKPHLVKAPRQCIDYVLVHELAHLKHWSWIFCSFVTAFSLMRESVFHAGTRDPVPCGILGPNY